MEKVDLPILTDEQFHGLLPKQIKDKASRFFTPSYIAIQSAKWLSGNDERTVLDIGAGVGKFCLYGAHHTKSHFLGIEMRPHLVKVAEDLIKYFDIKNAEVIHGNITDFQFSEYGSFYLFNPFQENITPELRMDDSVLLARRFYYVYKQHTFLQLALAKKGTRLVTYHGTNYDVPNSYKVVEEFDDGELKFWVKQD
jgi:predicted RNA methylase